MLPIIEWRPGLANVLSEERWSADRGPYYLSLAPHSLDESIARGDVRGCINHDLVTRPLGAARVDRDSLGWWASVMVGEFTEHSVQWSLRRGGSAAGSMGIEVERGSWERDSRGRLLCIVTSAILIECSLLVGREPAFTGTAGTARLLLTPEERDRELRYARAV